MGKNFWTFDRGFAVFNGTVGLLLTGAGTWFAAAAYLQSKPPVAAVVAQTHTPPTSIDIVAPWWAYALFGLGVAMLIIQLVVALRRKRAPKVTDVFSEVDDPNFEEKLESITGKHFFNETVLLDGKLHAQCEFENVTLVYNGGPFSMRNNKLGAVIVTSNNPKLKRFGELLLGLGIMKTTVFTKEGRLTHDEFLAKHGNQIGTQKLDDPKKV